MVFLRDLVFVSQMFVAAGNLPLFRYIDTSEGKAKRIKLTKPLLNRYNLIFYIPFGIWPVILLVL